MSHQTNKTAHFHKNNSFQYESQCTRLLSTTINSHQNYLLRMMKYGICWYLYYAQTILELSGKIITMSQKTIPVSSSFAKKTATSL